MAPSVSLDTDNGPDGDDCLALAVIFGSLELDLVGGNSVHGDVILRAHMLRKLLRPRGLSGVSAITGAPPVPQRAPPLKREVVRCSRSCGGATSCSSGWRG